MFMFYKCHFLLQDNTNNTDICGPNWTQNSSIYSGRLESPPPSQYMQSVYSCRNDYEQSKRMILQKNGKYTLTLSNYKNMVLSVFRGNIYSHIWDNKNKNHVLFNLDELAYMLKSKTVVQSIMEQLLVPNAEKKCYNFPYVVQKNGRYTLDLSGDKKMVLSLFKGNVYHHIWNNKNKKHVSLNSDELMCVLSNEANIEHITELLSKDMKQ